jgi:tetratricopeptide (TPR) repeat protein
VIATIVLISMPLLTSLWHKEDPLVTTPVLALQNLSAKSLYYNGAARPWLLAQRADILTAEDRDDSSARTRSFVQAVQNPKLFRQLDRQHRFDTLLLVGDPSQYRPLLEHLLEAKDWTLQYLDHTSLIYRRSAATAWKPEDFSAVRERFTDASAAQRGTVFSQAANKMIAIRATPAALKLLEEAQHLNSKSSELWSTWGHYRMALGQWKEAVAAADQALLLDNDYVPALACKAQSLYAMKYFSDAYNVSRKLIEELADDPALLFYHAKIAHEARAYSDEIRTLDKLIKMAEEQERPSSGYRVYLGQAYATDGQAEPALEQFAKALADPELPTEQRKFAVESSAMIRSRTGG